MSTSLHRIDNWSPIWHAHLRHYWSTPPRLGYWIATHFRGHYRSLELGAGSCRDSYYLSSRGWLSTAIDANADVVQAVAARFHNLSFSVMQADAFTLPFAPRSFDVTFSNGFWGLFSDKEIYCLISEQLRVTSKVMLAVLHNAENERLRCQFAEKAKSDPLYNIRFFTRREIIALLRNSVCGQYPIRLHKFGGPFDGFYLRRLGFFAKAVAPWVVPLLYRLSPWSRTERIICEIVVD